MQNSIDHIAEACHRAGVTEVVICPGSRNAPLTIALVRSGHFNCLPVADERSAAFIALGKAIALQRTVAVICTSGSAVVNFFPAVAEAFYQRVPLLVISADRPPELIDQWDGQTIRQEGVFGRHVKGSFSTPDAYEEEAPFASIVNEAIHLAETGIRGPVHINVPLREPFYPKLGHRYRAGLPPVQRTAENRQERFALPSLKGKKVLVIRGMASRTPIDPEGLAVYEDIVAGGTGTGTLSEQLFMVLTRTNQLAPDIVLSEGGQVLPKSIKKWLRENPPAQHFHFAPDGDIADPFQSRPQLVKNSLSEYIPQIKEESDQTYPQTLKDLDLQVEAAHKEMLSLEGWNEFKAVYDSLSSLPSGSVLHVANSMVVRYVSFCKGLREGLEIHGNRGTSGIDGCVSTAVGFASMDSRPQFLFTGDIAFFYDSNAFWNPLTESSTLKVILFNNRGGGIFRLIDGPAEQPELEAYFETRHQRDAKALCQNLGVDYFCAENPGSLEKGLTSLKAGKGPAVLEVFTTPEQNQEFFKLYKSKFNDIKISMGNHQDL